jgi:hypothetical protein
MNRDAGELTIHDLGDLLEKWESANIPVPIEGVDGLESGDTTIITAVQVLLGNLYLRGRISIDDLRQLAKQVVLWHVQWERVSFGIGMESGLGWIADGQVQGYLLAFDRLYLQFLLGLHARRGTDGLSGEEGGKISGVELRNAVHDASVRLANSGHDWGQARADEFKRGESLLAQLFGGLAVSVTQDEEYEDRRELVQV